jgi:hypothetical protein
MGFPFPAPWTSLLLGFKFLLLSIESQTKIWKRGKTLILEFAAEG